ncbi:hypothetical protein ACRDNQ_07285 [Palleronia sp. KMU-117]|uniref:hypothetical protein n=1 Tax=Palleronia sp. KMU-117 TaxID=3434108 RepID=UPI003D75C0D0
MAQIFQAAAIVPATIGTGAATMTVMNQNIPDFAVPEGEWTATHLLDGRSFHIVAVDLDSVEVLRDELIFRDGTFQSVNCPVYCDFCWSDYETKVREDVIQFTARTICPDAPRTVV